MPVIDRLLGQHLLVVGPFFNTLDIFRLVKFRQRGYVVIEPNLEKRCIKNTLAHFEDQAYQDIFLNRSKAVLTAIAKKKDKASLLAFCDLFQKLHSTLISSDLHKRMYHSLAEITAEATRVLKGVGIHYEAPKHDFSERFNVLAQVSVQLKGL